MGPSFIFLVPDANLRHAPHQLLTCVKVVSFTIRLPPQFCAELDWGWRGGLQAIRFIASLLRHARNFLPRQSLPGRA
jgi:hypothetical protein